MVVQARNATDPLRGVAEATVDAEDNLVYEGIVHGLIHEHLMARLGYEAAREFRSLRRLLSKIVPLSRKLRKAS